MSAIILSCEHASAALPKDYQAMYSQLYLHSHCGYDSGAYAAFLYLQNECKLWGIAGKYSRLLIYLYLKACIVSYLLTSY